MGPNEVADQSIDRISLPISPPPTSQSCVLVSCRRTLAPDPDCSTAMRSFSTPGFHIGQRARLLELAQGPPDGGILAESTEPLPEELSAARKLIQHPQLRLLPPPLRFPPPAPSLRKACAVRGVRDGRATVRRERRRQTSP